MARLLVVEDEPRLRSFLVRVLERDGHVVVTASTGPEGVRLATGVDVEGVILDLMLPGYDGFEVLRRVLEHEPDKCVIVLSAVCDVASRVRCLSMGATDFLAKPFATSELTARVKARLRTPAPSSSQRWLQVGDVSLDSERRSMTVDGHEISLSHREFVLLTHLMRKPGLVCTRDELLASVWGYTFDPGSNVVDVYVRRVRSKLPRPVIETVRNVGYSYVAI